MCVLGNFMKEMTEPIHSRQNTRKGFNVPSDLIDRAALATKETCVDLYKEIKQALSNC